MKRVGPQIANPLIATFAEGPLIANYGTYICANRTLLITTGMHWVANGDVGWDVHCILFELNTYPILIRNDEKR
jgi:hypothetical protein